MKQNYHIKSVSTETVSQFVMKGFTGTRIVDKNDMYMKQNIVCRLSLHNLRLPRQQFLSIQMLTLSLQF
ncbi:unnamed protein product [Allacma fusca]|uniref:Uncharacterized protein n=1 Tax=Allacma fusca TaxID=39272 RepID=A0A8J2J9A4_9HEXA|nr:unnamed protein product [Allacma fusca]